MVTVRMCSSLREAYLFRSRLEGSGITAFIPDEFTAQNVWSYSGAMGGVRVQVPDDQAEAALELVQGEDLHEKNFPRIAIRCCPSCGTPLTPKFGFRVMWRLMFSMLMTTPMDPPQPRSWWCLQCRKTLSLASAQDDGVFCGLASVPERTAAECRGCQRETSTFSLPSS